MGDGVQVRPLALYPLILLMLLVTLPRLLTRDLPSTLIPFFIFVLAALASTALGLTRDTYPRSR